MTVSLYHWQGHKSCSGQWAQACFPLSSLDPCLFCDLCLWDALPSLALTPAFFSHKEHALLWLWHSKIHGTMYLVPSTLSSHSPHSWAFLAGLWDPVFLTSYIFGKDLLVSVSWFFPQKNGNGSVAFPEAWWGSAWAIHMKSLAPMLPGYIIITTGEYEVSVLHLLLTLIPDFYKVNDLCFPCFLLSNFSPGSAFL